MRIPSWVLSLCAASTAFAQTPDLKTPISYARAVQSQVRGYVERAADKMPEVQYAFKPDPEVRSFGEVLGHIADAEYLFCSAVLGESNPSPGVEKGKKTKAEITAAVRAAFAYCDKAYSGITEAAAAETVKVGNSERNKLGLLSFNTTHGFEHYGNLVVYMRIKGIVPPSSEPR
jgi:uncharacterized damage-inducible protein DinB